MLLGPFAYTKSSGPSLNSDLEKIYSDLISNLGSLYQDSLYVKIELLNYAKAIYNLKLQTQEEINNRFIPSSYTYNLQNEVNKFNLGFLRSDKEKRDFLEVIYKSVSSPQTIYNIETELRKIAPIIFGQQPVNSITINTFAESVLGQNRISISEDENGNPIYVGANGNIQLSKQYKYALPVGGTDANLTLDSVFYYSNGLPGYIHYVNSASMANLASKPKIGDVIELWDTTDARNTGKYIITAVIDFTTSYRVYFISTTELVDSSPIKYSFQSKYREWQSSMDVLRIYLNPNIDNTSKYFNEELMKINVFLQQTLPAHISWTFYQQLGFVLGPDDGNTPYAARLDGFWALTDPPVVST